MTFKPRPISGNLPFYTISIDYNRYCDSISGNTIPGGSTPPVNISAIITFSSSLLSEDAVDVPIPISLTSANFDFSLCDSTGMSIGFKDALGNSLNFSRQRHDQSAESAAYIVRVPLISSTVDTEITMSFAKETARHDFFSDAALVDSTTLTRSTNKPVKYVSNPVFGNVAWTWDALVSYPNVLTDDSWPSESRYRMYYTTRDSLDPINYCMGYAISADGITWTKPILNQVTYEGDSNNNLLALDETDALGYDMGSAFYDADTDIYYIVINAVGNGAAISPAHKLYKSTTGPTGPFNIFKTFTVFDDGSNNIVHGMGISKLADGRWITYYQHFNPTTGVKARSIGSYVSNTTDITGSWEDIGILSVGTANAGFQNHGVGNISNDGGSGFMMVDNYGDIGNLYGPVKLQTSRNQISLVEEDSTFIPFGSGSWDDDLLRAGATIRVGDEWYMYYDGSNIDTLATFRQVGLAKIGYGRIAQYAQTSVATGTLITEAINVASAGLFINAVADGASDKIEVELLDASDDSVITNFAVTDCTDFTGDGISTEIKWGANGFENCPVSLVKVKFYLTKATNDVKLHQYSIGAETDTIKDQSAPPGVFTAEDTIVQTFQDDPIIASNAFVRAGRIPSNTYDQVAIYRPDKLIPNQPIQVDATYGLGQDHSGTNNLIHFGDFGDFGTDDFSVVLVGQRTQGIESCRVAKFNDPGGDGWYLNIGTDASGSIHFASFLNGNLELIEKTGLTLSDKIYAVAAKRTSGAGDLFIDGVKEVTGASVPQSIDAATSQLDTNYFRFSSTDFYFDATYMFMLVSFGAKPDGYLEALTAAYDGSLLTVV